MDCRANSDLFFLPDEKFDFDVSLSPASSKGDEDEVFLDPVGHNERCVSVDVVSRLDGGGGGVQASGSPLTGDQLEAVFQEAHRLADQLQNNELNQPHGGERGTAGTTSSITADGEQFVQGAEAKLGMLGWPASMCSPIKRQTFLVQDSPMKELPPAIQRSLLRGSSANAASSTRPTISTRLSVTAAASTRLSTRLSTSSPARGAKAQTRPSLRGKAMLGVGVVLPSKPAAMATSCSSNKSRLERSRLQPPSQTVGRKQSLSSRPSSRAQSCEDLLSDSTSVASDISDSSLNSSMVGRRPLAPPKKSVVRNPSGVKPPPLQSRRGKERKNTSSSSSSVSSFNSSLSVSPATGKMNSSLNRSQSTSIGPAPSSISRLASQTRQRRSTAFTPSEPSSAIAGRRSLSTQARKLSEAEHIKAARSTPLKKAVATPLQPTPGKRVSERTVSIRSAAAAWTQSGLKAKPQALVPPTPSSAVRGGRNGDGVSSPDVSKLLKPKRLISVNSIVGLPQKPSAAPLTPAGSCRSLQMKVRRPSALPTPLKRRVSAIPIATPNAHTRPARPVFTSDHDNAADRTNSCSPPPADTPAEEPVDAPDIQPFCLEDEEQEEEAPVAQHFVTLQSDQSESSDTGTLNLSQSEPKKDLIELEESDDSSSKTQEVLLLDLPAPTLQPQEKLLIDLSNTPDLIRTSGKTCTSSQQLIDLSSPLIKWSPDDKKENNAPLINLSF